MTRYFATAILALSASFAIAQTQLRISDLSITEKGNTVHGADVTASLNGAQGKKSVVLYADQKYTVDGSFKVKTHNVRRQSAKQGAVYLTMNMTLKVDGKRNKRVVQKTFYAEQDRSSKFEEEFLIKRGIGVRKIKVSFTGSID